MGGAGQCEATRRSGGRGRRVAQQCRESSWLSSPSSLGSNKATAGGGSQPGRPCRTASPTVVTVWQSLETFLVWGGWEEARDAAKHPTARKLVRDNDERSSAGSAEVARPCPGALTRAQHWASQVHLINATLCGVVTPIFPVRQSRLREVK